MLEFLIPLIFAIGTGSGPGGGAGAPPLAMAGESAPAPSGTAELTRPRPQSQPGGGVASTAAAEAPARTPEPQVPTGRFTTAVEIRPILEATRPSWVAVQERDGQDFVYFTNLLSWRCGLWEIRYGLNGAEPTELLPLEPCHEETASPNAMVSTTMEFPFYITGAAGSVQSIAIEIVFDDGDSDAAVYARQSVLLP